ncbi:hypothetical protein Syn7502_01109 [Synechococcus sp. PCC 7502]|uniref:FAD-dependent oxidoreductase n=1 Tax=Synechococcus sp. PCC 7502 TaxID=1173263 RepID=UPI00029FCB63|nr:FAD-dependent oxidoreductase [Synechococcus sp. PCC 7502]AFY73218.1 hypothetical protein Syn7502_01109 [Synechococcus sp. PCC 7502]
MISKYTLAFVGGLVALSAVPALAQTPKVNIQSEECDILIAGGGLAGSAAAYESLLAGKTVCVTEITDWVGGQISAQGTSALDERKTQRSLLFFNRGYLELRERIQKRYGMLNPGGCWVSSSCFMPKDGHELLFSMLQDAAKTGKGTLKWYPNTVIKDLDISNGIINNAIAISHKPAPNAPPLNTLPLSQTILDAYSYQDSPSFTKAVTKFIPKSGSTNLPANSAPKWYVIDATETGELIGLADVPYRLGIDPLSYLEPSSSSRTADPYCPQGFTYTFAMQATAQTQTYEIPSFYARYAPYYSYELPSLASFPFVFTYRRIFTPNPAKFEGIDFSFYKKDEAVVVGDISMQNWTWGNDYRPGTSNDNLIYSREQLQASGQLKKGGWMGGLRASTLEQAELLAKGYFYWLVTGTTDSQLKDIPKLPNPNYIFLSGLDSPMGTRHGLSKYPYMREGRRIIGRPSWGYPTGFTISEIDISRRNYNDDYYKKNLPPQMYANLRVALAGLESAAAITGSTPSSEIPIRTRSTIYPDTVGIGHYAIDFHPCLNLSPVETVGNTERAGERRGQGQAYPFQIPLRALIPQKIDNLLIAGKSIATSHIAAAAYRVHSFEWSSGVAAGITASFALEQKIAPFELVNNLPRPEPKLAELQKRIEKSGNPIAFPDTSIFNQDWSKWE